MQMHGICSVASGQEELTLTTMGPAPGCWQPEPTPVSLDATRGPLALQGVSLNSRRNVAADSAGREGRHNGVALQEMQHLPTWDSLDPN